jgi:hypothetical protein
MIACKQTHQRCMRRPAHACAVTCSCLQAAAECVEANDQLMTVLAGMYRDKKSCMGVMHGGHLVGNISISDLRWFSPEESRFLTQPVGNYLLAMNKLPLPEVRLWPRLWRHL